MFSLSISCFRFFLKDHERRKAISDYKKKKERTSMRRASKHNSMSSPLSSPALEWKEQSIWRHMGIDMVHTCYFNVFFISLFFVVLFFFFFVRIMFNSQNISLNQFFHNKKDDLSQLGSSNKNNQPKQLLKQFSPIQLRNGDGSSRSTDCR